MRASASGQYNTSAAQRAQSRGKPGSRPKYEAATAAATSTGSNSRGTFSTTQFGRGVEEEHKRSRQAGAETQIYVRPAQRQGPSTFGDFTGNIKNFQMPEEDQLSSRKHYNDLEEEVKNMGQLPIQRGKFSEGNSY